MSNGIKDAFNGTFGGCACMASGKTVVVCSKHKGVIGFDPEADRTPLIKKIDDLMEANRTTNKPLKQATKYDSNKVPVELLPTQALEEIAKVLDFGRRKYDAWNWAKGFKWTRLIGAAIRHLYAYQRGEDKDPESGLSHLAHAGCCILFLLQHEITGLGEDDRYKEFVKGPNNE